MSVIKKYRYTIVLLFSICFFIPFATLGQIKKFPKDTIYIKYVDKTVNRKIPNWNYKGKYGTYFSIRDESGKHMSLFYLKEKSTDTLCILHLKNYNTLTLKEIRAQEINWVDRKFKDQKYKPYSGGSKNSVFVTYLIEVISKDKFVIYPVIWRNEGVID